MVSKIKIIKHNERKLIIALGYKELKDLQRRVNSLLNNTFPDTQEFQIHFKVGD